MNALLLSNFLDAIKLTSIKPKRIMLQTGAKNYGYAPLRSYQHEVDLLFEAFITGLPNPHQKNGIPG